MRRLQYYLFLVIALSFASTLVSSQQSTCDPDYQYQPIQGINPPTFNQFMQIYNKSYGTPEQFNKRCNIYYENLRKMGEQSQSVEWEVGTNQNFDVSEEQWQRRRHLDTKEVSEEQAVASTNSIQVRVGAPTRLDWNEKKKVTSIKNQGNCGGCWAFATCAYGESRLVINGTQSITIDLSQQFLIDCTEDSSCDGGYLERSFQQAADSGIPTETLAPFEEKSGFLNFWKCWAFPTEAIGYIPQAYYSLSDQKLIDLLQTSPLAISISSKGWLTYRGGIFKCNRGDAVDHAVLLVGYDAESWHVKNQWGQSWGEKGYIRVSRNKLYNCRIGTSAFRMSEKLSSLFILGMMLIAILGF